MCLVEIEGSRSCRPPARPPSATGWSSTRRPSGSGPAERRGRVPARQPPARLPGLRGECPPQDIAMGWGRAQPLHGPMPLQAGSALAAGQDRPRALHPLLPLRAVQPEVSEDEQLQLLDRGPTATSGPSTSTRTSPPSTATSPSCPVGALTSEAYRFRARPWEIEDSGSICPLCPSQCNVKFTVRDEQVERVLARDNHAVDDGWLCDKGRFGFQMIGSEERITEPRVGGSRPAGTRLDAIAERLRAAGSHAAAIVGGRRTRRATWPSGSSARRWGPRTSPASTS